MSWKIVSALIVAVMLVSCSAVAYCTVDQYGKNDDTKKYSDTVEQFLEICKVPRCSEHDEKIGQYLMDFAERYGLHAEKDNVGNVMIDHPGTKGWGVIIQAHQDMVPVTDDGVTHDFTKDPIKVIIEGDAITADGTTLGADDGTGIAVCLTALKDPALKDYRFRCIFTVDEESTFLGVNNLSVEWLYGFNRMVNVDNEADNEIILGSAGSGYSVSVFTPEISGMAECYRLDVRGLTGGHSGVDIHLGRANAISLVFGFLSDVDGLRISSVSGGTVKNSIPSSCDAVFSCDPNYDIEKAFGDYSAQMTEKYSVTDPGITMTLSSAGNAAVWTETDSDGLTDAILELPNGVIDETEEGVITSCNVGVIGFDGTAVTVTVMPRSAHDSVVYELLDDIETTMEQIGAVTVSELISCGWMEEGTNALIERTSAVMADVYGTAPKRTVTHGGLECGVFKGMINTLQIESIGLTILGPHTTDETTYISSIDKIYEVVCEILMTEDI